MKVWISMLVIGSIFITSKVHAENEVRMQKAFSAVSSYRGSVWQESYAEIVVKNLAYKKNVLVHIEDCRGEWKDIPGYFYRAINHEYEVWRVDRLHRFFPIQQTGQEICDLNFAIKYEVDGKTYWDNNRGYDYQLKADEGIYLTDHVTLDKAYLSQWNNQDNSSFSGGVFLANYGYQKEITIVYTVDNWSTINRVNADYSSRYYYGYSSTLSPNDAGFEYWRFYTVIPKTTSIEYYIEYKVNGEIFYDNNFGENYTTTLNN